MIIINTLYKYKNGNCFVNILKDGTKIRRIYGIPKPQYPESIDMKITDYCNKKCSFCHENSSKNGRHANKDNIFNILNDLTPGTEIAIGGGNPLSHPDLLEILLFIKTKKLIGNLTVNQDHLKNLFFINYIYGLGISITNSKELLFIDYPHIVIHLILGIHTQENLNNLIKKGYKKFLFLGYKQFGRGKPYFQKEKEIINNNIITLKDNIQKYFNSGIIISFDNLAISQLELKNILNKNEWEEFYMGEDGQFTMYIDAVKDEFSKNSISPVRIKRNEKNLREMFNIIKYKKGVDYEKM